MGQEGEIREIIINLKDARNEIFHVFVIGEKLHLQASKQSLSGDEITFLKKISFATKNVEDTMNWFNDICKGLTIELNKLKIIVKRADTVFVIVAVKEIIPFNALGILTDEDPKGTIGHIDDAVEEIKAVLSKQ
ncbi:MAG: hypothetical protein KAI57_01285 [Candidatus Pacebacteria bacterium]|nr:hypothetical protein [Candidatus Paceibacterota bacterium]